jgi:hypothetical protein
MIRDRIKKKKKMKMQQIINLSQKMEKNLIKPEIRTNKDKLKDGLYLKDMLYKKVKYCLIPYSFPIKQY